MSWSDDKPPNNNNNDDTNIPGVIMLVLLFIIYLINLQVKTVFTWDSEELELFDLVEEVNQNFYELLEISEDATPTEVRKAYRKLSLVHHPDKSKEEGAQERFRKIVAVSEVLRDDAKRKRYDLILRNGLPDWRQPVYYYRRVRRMGFLELMAFLFGLLTLGQYLVAWATYWERKYELEEVLMSKFKRRRKKNCRDQEIEIADHIQQLPRPCLQDLFPLQLMHLTLHIVISMPTYVSRLRESLKRPDPPPEEEDRDDLSATFPEKERKPRKRIKPDLPDLTGQQFSEQSSESEEEEEDQPQQMSRKDNEWTQNDTVAMIRAINRFPGGTPDRWLRIAETLGRPLSEVTEKAKTIKTLSTSFVIPTTLQGVTGKVEASWSQEQQKALEKALKDFPKGCTTHDRWDLISHAVSGKTKEECIQRYKELVELVKRKKATA